MTVSGAKCVNAKWWTFIIRDASREETIFVKFKEFVVFLTLLTYNNFILQIHLFSIRVQKASLPACVRGAKLRSPSEHIVFFGRWKLRGTWRTYDPLLLNYEAAGFLGISVILYSSVQTKNCKYVQALPLIQKSWGSTVKINYLLILIE